MAAAWGAAAGLVNKSIDTTFVTGWLYQLVFMISTVCQFVSVKVFQLVRHCGTRLVRGTSTATSRVSETVRQLVRH